MLLKTTPTSEPARGKTRAVKSLTWIAIALITVGPLLHERHMFQRQLKSQGLLAVDILITITGFFTHMSWRDQSVYRPGLFYKCKLLSAVLGAVPFYLFAVLMLIINMRSPREWLYLTPWPLLIHPLNAPASHIMPLTNYAYCVLACWAAYPLLVRPMSKLTDVSKLLVAIGLPITTCIAYNFLGQHDLLMLTDTTNLLLNPLFKLPIFCSGVLMADATPFISQLLRNSRIGASVIFDTISCVVCYLLLVTKTTPFAVYRTSVVLCWLISGLCSLSWMLERSEPVQMEEEHTLVSEGGAVSGTRIQEPTTYSLFHRMLASESMVAVLEEKADVTFTFIYRLLLEVYTRRSRTETLGGKGFLFYMCTSLVVCHLYSYYVWVPITKWVCSSNARYTTFWEVVYNVFAVNK